MTIGIIGSGNVGGTLGTRWAKAGHEVVFGTRDPHSKEVQRLVTEAGGNARADTLTEAAGADILLLATPWRATQEILEALGDLGGKVLIDATNPLLADMTGLTEGTTTSAGEQVAGWARGARVVKAFNTVGASIMADASFAHGRPVLFYCGDDPGAKEAVIPLIEELGFEAVDAGPLSRARLLEPFALLWISMAFFQGMGTQFAFQLMRR